MSDWRAKAACIGDPGPFDAPDGERIAARMEREAHAKAICGGCDVRAECLEAEMKFDTVSTAWTVRGGKTPDERKAMLRKRQRARRRQAS